MRPNILIMIADDATYNDLTLYGGQNVQTANIDRLAEQGLVFNRAYLPMAMCNPCRTALYTGLHPVRNGSCWNHSAARPGTKSIVHYLEDLSYRVGLSGKKHVLPAESFQFEFVPGIQPSCVHPDPEFGVDGVREFIGRNKDEPFCLVTGLTEPHSPWTLGDYTHFDQETLKLPPFLADTPETREDFARYLAEIEVLDQKIGEILGVLEESGQADNTLVIFTSEQGSQFPGCKWTNWNTGVHTGFIVRWPGHMTPGRTDAIIQYEDVVPTLIQAAGGNPETMGFDGVSFLSVLQDGAKDHREYSYFVHNNIPEGPPYPIRSVTDGTHHYIRNLTPDAIYIEKHLMGQNKWHQYWPTWVVDSTFNEHTRMLVNRYMHRPAEQLYHMDDDPFEMTNLADDPAHAEAKARLSTELDQWMKEQGDPGAEIDTEEQWQAAKDGRHFERQV